MIKLIVHVFESFLRLMASIQVYTELFIRQLKKVHTMTHLAAGKSSACNLVGNESGVLFKTKTFRP